MFRFFERLLEPTEPPPDAPPPELGAPHALLRFYWHFVRQIPGLLIALFATGFVVALLDAGIPVFIGGVVSLVSQQQPESIGGVAGTQVRLLVGVVLVLGPVARVEPSLVAH